MIAISGSNATDVWSKLGRLLIESGRKQSSRIGPTIELRHVVASLGKPRDRVVFARPINPAFAVAEVVWILSGSNGLPFVHRWNPRMRRYSEPTSLTLAGAYGLRLGSRPRLGPKAQELLGPPREAPRDVVDQLRRGAEALSFKPDTRQVVLQIWDSKQDLPNPGPRAKDVPCSLVSHLLYREGALDWLQVMRSTDLVWGLPYNLIQWTSIQEIVAGWLGLKCGQFTSVSGSLHAYEQHWDALGHWTSNSVSPPKELPGSLKVRTYEAWEETFSKVAETATLITKAERIEDVAAAARDRGSLPVGYAEWIALLEAERMRRLGDDSSALDAIKSAGQYWRQSWLMWRESKLAERTITGPVNSP